MGRLSALILQAVCLAGWLTERQADAYVIAANSREKQLQQDSRSFCKKKSPGLRVVLPLVLVESIKIIGGERADIYFFPGTRSCRSPCPPTGDLLPGPVTLA